MSRFVEVIDVAMKPGEAFDALSDFSNTAEWDPGVKSAIRTTSAPLGIGSRFIVEVTMLGQSLKYSYAITEFDRPHRVVLEGGNVGTRLRDEITFVPSGSGTRITYEVQCELLGVGRLAEGFLDLALPIIGRRAVAGLKNFGRAGGAFARTNPSGVTLEDLQPSTLG